MNQYDETNGKIERKAAIFERSVNLPHETAMSVAEDLATPGTRKPSSDAVDRQRNARAQAEQRAEGTS